MKTLLLLILTILIAACSDLGSTEPGGGEFAIYLLEDPNINAWTALSSPIDDLALGQSPFLRAGHLRTYSWSTHSLTLKSQLEETWAGFQHGGKVYGVPFVVTVGRKRIYVGSFWWAYSSLPFPPCPYVEVLGPSPYAIRMEGEGLDPRGDPRIFVALTAAGILVE